MKNNSTYNTLFLVLKRSLLLLLLTFFSAQTFAYENETRQFISTIEDQVREFDDEVLTNLYTYRREVEAQAYTNTLKLCEGYRRAKGWGPHPYHGKYMFTEEEAMEQWARVMFEGAKHPLSAINGIKAEYIAAQNIGFFDFYNWFGSMYSLYLVNSLGFLGAAMHCLDTMNQGDINDFAATILIVDYEMSLVSETALFWTSGKILSVIAKSTRWVWNPIGKMMSSAAARIGKPRLMIAGIVIGGIGADNFMHFMKDREEYLRIMEELLEQESKIDFTQERKARFLLLDKAYKVVAPLAEREKTLRTQNPECPQCTNLYQPFYQFVGTNFNDQLLQQMEEDLNYLKRKSSGNTENLTDSEKAYQILLIGFLSVVKEVYNQTKG